MPVLTQMIHLKSPFNRMRLRHDLWKKKYPDRKPISATPYEGVENLRPETQRMVDAFLASKKGKP